MGRVATEGSVDRLATLPRVRSRGLRARPALRVIDDAYLLARPCLTSGR
jgi:hypothetical protein